MSRKFTQRELDILHAIHIEGTASATELAKALNLHRSTVSMHLASICRKASSVDLHGIAERAKSDGKI